MRAIKFLAVIFVLVSLVIGLIIASYDPVEKAKISQDEKLQQDAGDFIQASVQYYTVKGGMPWFGSEENGILCFAGGTKLNAIPMSQMQQCLDALVLDSTLRKNAITPITAKKLFVTNPSTRTNSSLDSIICFQPQSKQWQNDSNTRFNKDGTAAVGDFCISQGGSAFCYWCTD